MAEWNAVEHTAFFFEQNYQAWKDFTGEQSQCLGARSNCWCVARKQVFQVGVMMMMMMMMMMIHDDNNEDEDDLSDAAADFDF